jgi:hypothetical protein
MHTLLKRAGGGEAGGGGGCELSQELLKAADMLARAGNLTRTLLDQGKHAEAEEMLRERPKRCLQYRRGVSKRRKKVKGKGW